MASIAHGIRVGLHDYFQPWEVVFVVQIHSDKKAEGIADFVRNVLQKALGIARTDDVALVIVTQVESAALGIRKATDLTEEVILPDFFPVEMLVFFHVSFFWMAGSLAEVFVENSKIPHVGIRLKKCRETGFHPKETLGSIGECTKKPPAVLRRAGG